MDNERIFAMKFARVYPLLVAKVQRKGHTKEEVDRITGWLTGYTAEDLERFADSELSYGDFFRNAPKLNEKRHLIRGSICGVKIEAIQDPLLREIRYLDKLVDELAKGKPMAKILRE